MIYISCSESQGSAFLLIGQYDPNEFPIAFLKSIETILFCWEFTEWGIIEKMCRIKEKEKRENR